MLFLIILIELGGGCNKTYWKVKSWRGNPNCWEDVDFEQSVDEIQIHREEALEAKKGDEVGIKVDERVWKG